MEFLISRHAEEELLRRSIPRESLLSVLATPEQRIVQSGGKEIFQSRFTFEGGKMYLLRAVLAWDKSPPVVITVYRTSKIEKYWVRQ